MLKDEADRLTRVVVSTPRRAYFEIDDLAAHNVKAAAERETTLAQHQALRQTMTTFGAEVIDVPELAGHPNSVFTQDVAVVTPEGFIRLRMGLPSRRGEPVWMADALTALGEPEVGRIQPPGTVEGGDVILTGEVAFVGHSARTNVAGIAQLVPMLERMGYEVRVLTVPPPSLHIGGMVSVVGPRQLLVCEGTFPQALFRGFEVIYVPQGDMVSGNVIALGDGAVIVEAQNTTTITALEAHGFTVHVLALSEFVKGSGGPTCLILPLERGP